MENKYFAKFLVVNEEIKKGDRVIDLIITPKQGLTYIKEDTFINDFQEEVTLPQWQTRFNFKKIKLFLCTHNIPPEQILRGGSDIYLIHDPKDKNEEKAFKVIGEISDKAIWVNQGDEFSEDELEGILYCKMHPDESMYMDNIEQIIEWNKHNPKPIQYKPVIKIKCNNCNTYH